MQECRKVSLSSAFRHSCILAFLHFCISCRRQPPPLRSPCSLLRRVRRASRTSNPRPGLRGVLVFNPAADPAALRPLRRSAALVAGYQHPSGHVRAVPAWRAGRRSRTRHRRLRRRTAGHHPCAQVRRTAIAGTPAGRVDALARRRNASRRRLRSARTAALVAAATARVQSGVGSGPPSRPASRAIAASYPADRHADRPFRRQATRQRSWRVCTGTGAGRAGRAGWAGKAGRVDRGAGGRCQHYRRDAERLRARAQAGGGSRGSRAYGSASRDVAAVNTSAAISSLARSPSRTTQPDAAACSR